MSSPATGPSLDGPGPATAAVTQTGEIPAELDISQYGPSEVYHPPDGQAVLADIVFVHGLMGHPIKTWLHGKAPEHNPSNQDDSAGSRLFRRLKLQSSRAASVSTQSHCYWPLLLGQELKCARIITYGYNSKPFSFLGIQPPPGQMTIEELATNLMQSVTARRRGHEGRPLIFIAHSLGGILAKSALVESTKVRPDIADSCVAIFFFGTPHSGSGWADKGGYVANIIQATCTGSFKTQVLKGLRLGSETLTRITKDFNDLLVRAQKPVPRYGIRTFIEGTGVLSWGVTGKVVDNTSARYNRRDVEQEFTIQGANHMDMCRFESRKNRDYQQVVAFLEECLDSIREEINQEKEKAAAEAARAAVRETEAKRVQAEKEAKVLIEALDYDHRLAKDQYINRKAWAPESLDWIWDSEFGTWLSSPEPIFWISGKPGSGKSTLTSYIAQSPHLKTRLKAAAAPSSKLLVLLHFFNYQLRQELGNNFAGLLRSLLHGLLDKVLELVPALQKELNIPDIADKAKTWVLNTGQVQSALLWSMRAVVEKGQTLVLFIDGLDELDQAHQWDVSRFIQELNRFNSGKVKICLSSRNIPPFSDILVAYPTLLISEHNHLAIKSWAEESLKFLQGIRDTKSLARQIAEKSEGVFLWAHFAVEEALRLISGGYGRDPEKMEAMLLDQPQELKGIYSRIIQRIREEDRTTAGVYFSLVFGRESTDQSLSEFYEASTLAIESYLAQTTYRSGRPKTEGGHQYIGKQKVICEADLRDFWRRVSSVCGGMIVASQIRVKNYGKLYYEPLEGGLPRANYIKVSAMHRTVQEHFCSGTGWRELFGDGVNVQEWSYEPWVRACFAFLRAPLTWSHDAAPAAPAADDSSGSDDSSSSDDWGSSVDLSSYDDDDMPTDNPKLEIAQQSLARYVLSKLGEHLLEYDEVMSRSSKSFAYDVSFEEYYEAHRTDPLITIRSCSCLSSPPQMTWNLELRSDIKFAISHGLVHYIQDCLEQPDDADMMSIQDVFTFAAHCSIADLYNHERIRRRQTAVLPSLVEYAKRKNKPIQPLDDFTMYQVLRFSPVEPVKICLEIFPKGPIVLRPPYFEGCRCTSAFRHRFCEIMIYTDRPPVEYTPFHPLARTTCERERNELIVRLLLERGENIKALCGPEGNVIHAELEFQVSLILDTSLFDYAGFPYVELWMEFGADIHGENSEGLTPLELFWRRVSEAELCSNSWILREQIDKIRRVICLLLKLGAVNRKEDANGRIPDLETMKNFGEDLLPERERRPWRG